MHPQLQQLIEEANHNSERLHAMFAAKDVETLTRRPPKGGWSAVECIEHLTLTTGLYEKVIPPAVGEAKQKDLRASGPFKMDFKGRMLKWMLEPPYRMKVKTYHLVDVQEAHNPQAVLEEFLASQEKVCAMISSCNGLALDKIWIASPFNDMLKYNLYSALANMIAHQRRHLWQAEQALASLRG